MIAEHFQIYSLQITGKMRLWNFLSTQWCNLIIGPHVEQPP